MKYFERPLLVVLAISVLMLSIVLITPLDTDDLIYHSMALDLYRHGAIPYLGSWDQNFPGMIFIHYVAILLFGTSDLSVRLFDGCIQLMFIVVFYRFCRLWLKPRTSAIAVLLYLFYYVTAGTYLYTERDVYGGMGIITALYVALNDVRIHGAKIPLWKLWIAGLIAGIAITIRPSFALAFLLIGVAIYVALKQQGAQQNRGLALWNYFVAGTIPSLLIIMFYALIPGGLHAFYLATIRFNLDIYSALDGGPKPATFLFITVMRGYLLPLALLGVIASRRNRIRSAIWFPTTQLWRRSELAAYWALTLSFFLIAIAQPSHLSYHFAPFYMMLCPLAAIGVEQLLAWVPNPALRIAGIVAALALYSVLKLHIETLPQSVGAFVEGISDGTNPWRSVYASYRADPLNGARPEWAVERYLSKAGNDTGIVEVCSFDPALRAHLNRQFAGPYILPTAIALAPSSGTVPAHTFTDYQMQWRMAYMDSLCARRPQFIVLARYTAFWSLVDPYPSYLHGLPGFDSLLGASYRYDTSFGAYQLFRRIR